MVTGIRGLCNGLGPALYGCIFYLFHVDLNIPLADLDKDQMIHPNATVSGEYSIKCDHLFQYHIFWRMRHSSYLAKLNTCANLFLATAPHIPSPMRSVIPGPPFVFGSVLVRTSYWIYQFITLDSLWYT